MFMKRAEKIIRQQINDLTDYRIPFKKIEIEQAIKFFYWQGTFRRKKYIQMMNLLNIKYTEIMDEYTSKVIQAYDRDYKALLKRYGIED